MKNPTKKQESKLIEKVSELPKLKKILEQTDGEQMFVKSSIDISTFIDYMDKGILSKHSVQRGYKWTPSDVKSFLESVFQQYPIGIITLWMPNASTKKEITMRPITYNSTKNTDPIYFIIDGQQRISSMYAIFTGNPIYKNNSEYYIYAYYNPIEDGFTVFEKNPTKLDEYSIPLIRVYNKNDLLSQKNADTLWEEIKHKYINFTEDDRMIIRLRLKRLCEMVKTEFNCSILKISNIGIAMDLFESVNKGKQINRNEHLLAMLSAWDREVKDHIDKFSDDTFLPYNPKNKNSFANRIGLKLKSEEVTNIVCYYTFKAPMSKMSNRIRRENKSDSLKNIGDMKSQLPILFDTATWQEYIEILESMYIYNVGSIDKLIFEMTYIYFVHAKCNLSTKSKKEISTFIKSMVLFLMITERYRVHKTAIKDDLTILTQADPIEDYKVMMTDILTDSYWENEVAQQMINTTKFDSVINLVYHISLMAKNEHVMFSSIYTIADYYKNADLRSKGTKDNSRKIEKHHIYSQTSFKKIPKSKMIIQPNSIVNIVLMDEQIHASKTLHGHCTPFEWLDMCSNQDARTRKEWMKRYSIDPEFSSAQLSNVTYENYVAFIKMRSQKMAQNIKLYYDNLWR